MHKLDAQHPEQNRLTSYGLGRLSAEESQAIELHLASCASCCRQVDEAPDDLLVSLLRNSASDTKAGLPSFDTDASSLTKKSTPPAFKVPRELDGHARYHVLAPLGAGGMGTVYKARHRLMERVVALKIINPHLVDRPGAMERFTREVRAAALLAHPNIVTAYDAEHVGDLQLLVMEFVEGQTLAQILAVERELPIARACEYLRQTALGLQHALERGMVHRDIKPQNLMVVNTHQLKILDFGLARFASELAPSEGSTEHGTLMGSPDYMAPEQGQDAHAADTRADIYGMGCTLYHLLAGQVPFPQTSLLAKLEAHRDKQPVPLNRLRPEVPAQLAQVVAKMMAKQPAQRYQTPAEVAEALRPFTQDGRASGRKPDVFSASRTRRTYALTLAALGALALLAAATVFFLIGEQALEPDRKAAEYILSIGGKVRVNEQAGEITAARDLPPVPFRLWTIFLNGNKQLTDAGLANFKGCKHLTDLGLGGTNAGDAGLVYLRDCKDLTTLALDGTQVSDAGLAFFKDCKHLKGLFLANTKVTDRGLAHFKHCNDLAVLTLDRTHVGDAGVAYFKNCKNLYWLWLSNTQVSDVGLAYFKDCKNMYLLGLDKTQVSDSGLAHFKDYQNLKSLALAGTKISDQGLSYLKDCKNMKDLILQKTMVTAAGVAELEKALPQCKIQWDRDDNP